MTSTTLFSNKTNFASLCKNLMKRNLGAMIYLTILGFVFFPLQYILTTFSPRFDRGIDYALTAAGVYPDALAHTYGGHTPVSLVFFTMIMLITPVVVGISQLSYLQSKRAVDVYHSLPVTRDSLMSANFIVSFCTIMLPALFNYIATVLAVAFKAASTPYTFAITPLITDLGIWAIIVLAILAVIAFVAVQVGSSFDNFVFSGELLLAPAAVILLGLMILDQFMLGFSISNIELENLLLYSPVTLVIWRYVASVDNGDMSSRFLRNTNIALIVWLGLALLLFAAAMLIYRKRKSELAERNVSSSPIAQLGKLIFVYLGGLLIGLMFYTIFEQSSRIYFAVWSVLGAALVYVLSEVILLRGFKGLSKSLLPGLVPVALVGIFAFAAVGSGFGYVNKLPELSSIESVSINYRGRYGDIQRIKGSTQTMREQFWWEGDQQMSSPYYNYERYDDVTLTTSEAISMIRDYHKGVLDYNTAPEQEDDQNGYYYNSYTISYTLKGGKTLIRRYQGEEIPNSVRRILAELEGTEEFKRQTHPIFNTTAADYKSILITDSFGLKNSGEISNVGQIERLLEAMANDMLEEDIGRVMNGSAKVLGYVKLNSKINPFEEGTDKDLFIGGHIIITEDYRRTVALIREMGFGELMTEDLSTLTSVGITTSVYSYDRSSSILKPALEEYLPIAIKETAYEEEYDSKLFGSPDFTSDDPAMIRRLTELSFVQAYIPDNNQQGLITLIFYGPDNREGISRFIHMDQLPSEIVEELPQWYKDDIRAKMERARAIETVVAAAA